MTSPTAAMKVVALDHLLDDVAQPASIFCEVALHRALVVVHELGLDPLEARSAALVQLTRVPAETIRGDCVAA